MHNSRTEIWQRRRYILIFRYRRQTGDSTAYIESASTFTWWWILYFTKYGRTRNKTLLTRSSWNSYNACNEANRHQRNYFQGRWIRRLVSCILCTSRVKTEGTPDISRDSKAGTQKSWEWGSRSVAPEMWRWPTHKVPVPFSCFGCARSECCSLAATNDRPFYPIWQSRFPPAFIVPVS